MACRQRQQQLFCAMPAGLCASGLWAVQRAGWRALSDARLSLSVPSPISFSSRADMRSKSACDPEYLWCAAVLYCPATNAESASDESSSSEPEAYSEPPCCRFSRRPSDGRRRRSAVLQHVARWASCCCSTGDAGRVKGQLDGWQCGVANCSPRCRAHCQAGPADRRRSHRPAPPPPCSGNDCITAPSHEIH